MRRGQRLFPWIPLCSGFPEVPPPTPGSNQCPSLHPTVGAAHPSLLCRLTGNTEDFHWSRDSGKWSLWDSGLERGDLSPKPPGGRVGWAGGLTGGEDALADVREMGNEQPKCPSLCGAATRGKTRHWGAGVPEQQWVSEHTLRTACGGSSHGSSSRATDLRKWDSIQPPPKALATPRPCPTAAAATEGRGGWAGLATALQLVLTPQHPKAGDAHSVKPHPVCQGPAGARGLQPGQWPRGTNPFLPSSNGMDGKTLSWCGHMSFWSSQPFPAGAAAGAAWAEGLGPPTEDRKSVV